MPDVFIAAASSAADPPSAAISTPATPNNLRPNDEPGRDAHEASEHGTDRRDGQGLPQDHRDDAVGR